MTDTSARVAVIGSGIAGASVAFGLASRDVSVTVFDDAKAGQATAASAGIIAPWVSTSTGPYYETYAAGGNFYPDFLNRLSDLGIPDLGYRRSGALVVNHDPDMLAEAARLIRERAAAAGPVAGEVHDMDSANLAEVFPPIGPNMTGLFISGGGRVDGRTLRDAILTGAKTYGARLVNDSARIVTAGRPGSTNGSSTNDGSTNGAGTWTVATTSAVEDFDAIVVAGGARSSEILERLGHTVTITAQRGQVVHLGLHRTNTSPWPTVHPLDHHYITPFDGGRVVIGATREDGVGFDVRATAAGQRQVLDDALRIAPGLAEATVLETRVGVRPMSTRPGGLPYAGAVPGASGLWLASGFGAGGLTMGPLIGDGMARAILGEEAPEIAHLAL
ncbi:D-amino-acid dehydrogenase [Brevibacterium sandarakinum]|uniref:D-amino-acid dehydrogenase n=1 Tax=Brevibacterium sandarakinum TaxID=629680 RepID=A0A1H1MEN7_BRESA|nr:FAD-dependent oxidoreductase [Brevibacterium sandarakinum]SDR85127.1 D-amino-acid dehydrogenase [Brevibacterium sandarakinum]